MRFGHDMLSEWALEPGMLYLNHGTVGATPRRVLAAQQALRDEMERQPARFVLRETTDFHYLEQPTTRPVPRLREAAAALAAFVGTTADALVFVDNATSGCGAVLGSLDLRPGDRILVTDHGYGAVTNAARHVAARAGAEVVTMAMPWPRFDRAAIVHAYREAITPRTRLVILDHVTSGSALVMPVEDILALARAAGARVLVDGAHAPGLLPLALDALDADWWTGNLHKWAMAPRSSAILVARADAREGLHPPVVSWGLGQGWIAEFDWVGTRDVTPWLAAPAGVAFMEWLGVDAMRAWQHALAWDGAQRLAHRWGVTLPMEEAQVAGMVTVPLPDRAGRTPQQAFALKRALLLEDHIEVQLHAFRERLWVRISGQVYNEPADLERLADAIDRRLGA